jgi:carboxymethylenebutenolidase
MAMPEVLSRREAVKVMGAGLPLAAILADPLLAQAAAAGLETVALTTLGGKQVRAALALPAKTPAPAVLLIHEWWGLNDQIKAVAGEFAREGYVALAVDLYDGSVATTPDEARQLLQGVDAKVATDTIVSWARWLKGHAKGTGKLAAVGWCLGGGWSLNTSIAEPVDATVVYYGRVDLPKEQLAHLRGPVLGHFATRDERIDRAMVSAFEEAMTAAGRPYTTHWYEADHAFANPSGARYDAEDTKLAWHRTLDFLARHLGAA